MMLTYKQLIESFPRKLVEEITRYDESFVVDQVHKRMEKTGMESPDSYCNYLRKSRKEEVLFNESINNNYSEFFRNALTFSVLGQVVLPTLLWKKEKSNQREIRIWSIACAKGQEAYSIAMLMEELKDAGYNTGISYRIFATDRDESQIEIARKGDFTASGLGGMSLKRLERWFKKEKDRYIVDPILSGKIDFSVLDIFDEHLNSPPSSIFGEFDIVLCANILFYYKPEYQKYILNKICKSLPDHGYIVTGETEREIFRSNNYREMYPHSSIFLKPYGHGT